jgi:hypothetical protein
LSALVDRTVSAQKQIMLLIIDTMVSAMITGAVTLNEKYPK